MRPPKLRNLIPDKKGTENIRRAARESKKIKITINIDEDSLHFLRNQSSKTGIPYQRLLNQILRESLQQRESHESRLERLEKEVLKLKNKVA